MIPFTDLLIKYSLITTINFNFFPCIFIVMSFQTLEIPESKNMTHKKEDN